MLNLKVIIHTTVVVKHTTIVVAERTAEVVAVHTTKEVDRIITEEVDRITTEEVIVRIITEEGIILVNHIVVGEWAVGTTSKGQAATEQQLKAVESLQHLRQRV